MSDSIQVLLYSPEEVSDPLADRWSEQCEKAGYKASRAKGSGLDLRLPEDAHTFDAIICLDSADLPTLVQERLNPHTVVLGNALVEPVSRTLEAQAHFGLSSRRRENFLNISALGLYLNRPTVEIAPTLTSDPDITARARTLLEGMNLSVIEVPEMPGLVLGRILAMLVNEATSALMEGVASPEDIDTAMRLGTNYPLGPLEWADQVGLDVILGILQALYQDLGEERYRPMPLLLQKVRAGHLGLKSGQGFYAHPSEKQIAQPVS